MFTPLRTVAVPVPPAHQRPAVEPRLRSLVTDLLAGLRGGALRPA